MVWKIFAPRLMAACMMAFVVDLGVLIGVSLAVGRVVKKVDVYFQPLLRK
jgi:phosphatidylinositol glycan class O